MIRPLAISAAVAALLVFAAGCAQSVTTAPPRSATEQLLLSTAADRAIARMSFESFSGKRVYCDNSYFDSYDSKYVMGAVRDALSRSGALLVSDMSKSDVVVELRSGALSLDGNESLVGFPKTGAPVPFGGAVQIPELALYKSTKQDSIAKFALLAYETESRTNVYSSGPMVGKSYNHYYRILGLIPWTRTDLPEKQPKAK